MIASFRRCAVLAFALADAASASACASQQRSVLRGSRQHTRRPPGTILRHRKPPSPIAAFGRARANLKDTHQILYKTVDSLNASVATVVTVLIPHHADLGKVLSYQFYEDAAAFDCSPSYFLQLSSFPGGPLGTVAQEAEFLLVEAALDRGWVVIVPDHQGPKAAFLADALAGHAVLDGIRAATRSTNFTEIQEDPTIAIWGYSGDALASGWAAELQPSYAPEVKIAGAALGGTVPNIMNAITVNKGPFAGLVPSDVLGLAHQYPEIDGVVKQHLRPEFQPAFNKFERQCLTSDVIDFTFRDVLAAFDDRNILTKEPVARIFQENDMGKATPEIPLFIYKGILDEVSPIADTDDLVENYCGNGASVEYVRDSAAGHAILFITGSAKALSWLAQVMDGTKPTPGCSTKSHLVAS